jgi:hypothetical protein
MTIHLNSILMSVHVTLINMSDCVPCQLIKWTFFKYSYDLIHIRFLFVFQETKEEWASGKEGQLQDRKNNLTTIVSHHLFWAKFFPSTYSTTWFYNLLHLQTNSNNYTYLDPLLAFDKNKALCLIMFPLIWILSLKMWIYIKKYILKCRSIVQEL